MHTEFYSRPSRSRPKILTRTTVWEWSMRRLMTPPRLTNFYSARSKRGRIFPEALNNLGILYLLTQRRDQAVASFEQCIRVAPTFDQAYLNLARVYAIEQKREKAREILGDLLKQQPENQSARQMLQQLQQ